jgi:hypothetical protein
VFAEWRRLGRKRHHEVFTFARRGDRHPDAVVASVAVRWAQQVVAGNRPWTDHVLGAPYLLVAFVVSLATDYSGDYPDPTGRRRQRLAEMVLTAIGDRPSAGA